MSSDWPLVRPQCQTGHAYSKMLLIKEQYTDNTSLTLIPALTNWYTTNIRLEALANIYSICALHVRSELKIIPSNLNVSTLSILASFITVEAISDLGYVLPK